MGVELYEDMREGLKGADVVMMLRLQKERMDGGFIPSEREYYHRLGSGRGKLALAKPDALVMHPGPINRGVEIDGTIADDINRSVIQDQVEMGVAVRMAALDLLARNLRAERVPHCRGRGVIMDQFFTNARLIDPETQTDDIGSLRVTDGRIAGRGAPEEAAPEGAAVIDCRGRALAPGLIDWGVKIGEPGERHKESFRSAGRAAAAGGVTTIIARPDTTPPIDTPEALEFVARRASDAPVHIRHMAALTKAREGREMVEIGFLTDLGAVAFTDGVRVVRDTKLLTRCMTYARGLDALIIGHPQEAGLSAGRGGDQRQVRLALWHPGRVPAGRGDGP